MRQAIPTIAQWLALPREDLAEQVGAHHLSVKVALDGTTRHYLLKHPELQGVVADFKLYAQEQISELFRLIDLLFSHGFETVLVLNVWPPDLERRADYVPNAVWSTRELVSGPEAREYYKRWDARVKLYGNYDISPVYDEVRALLEEVRAQLEAVTPAGSRLLLWGYCAGEPMDELIAQSVMLYQKLGRVPSEAEVRTACFPYGPQNLDIAIGGGWLRFGNADIIPILNHGLTDLYSLSHLPLDLTESEVRRILYDRLFLRHVASPTDQTPYKADVLEALGEYYDKHQECVLGLGHLVGPGLWYPNHTHDVS